VTCFAVALGWFGFDAASWFGFVAAWSTPIGLFSLKKPCTFRRGDETTEPHSMK
jgi:hypothetical protein